MRKVQALFVTLLVVLISAGLLSVSFAAPTPTGSLASNPAVADADGGDAPRASHRLIVQLKSPSLVEWATESNQSLLSNGRLMTNAPAAQAYVNQLQNEQAAFLSAMSAAVPEASLAHYLNETRSPVQATYQVVLNAVAVEVDTKSVSLEQATRRLMQVPGVAAVYRDYAHTPDLYASRPLINVDALWNNPAIGGMENAGEGIKIASVDGGLHHDAPMFSGEGYDYPEGFPEGGLGDTANNNGKIIVSRAYFRPWDAPALGDEHTWPGEQGTSHGVHTGSTAGGNPVTANYYNLSYEVSGVAPRAWMMSYRVFYYSVTGDESFYNVEGIAALEDVIRDGADVVNNSWGGGPTSGGGATDALDTALINLNAAGVFVSMSAGNAGPSAATSDHPSEDYMIAAASTTTGTIAAGRFNVTAPEPVTDEDMLDVPFGTAAFGDPLEIGEVYTSDYLPSEVVSPTNITGCSPWPEGTFEGTAALIQRGGCDFSQKAWYAQEAGAEFVVIYNQPLNGETVGGMSAGAFAEGVTISAVLIPQSAGEAMVEWYEEHGEAAEFTLDLNAYQAGNTPDIIIGFSSRGPGVGNTLKPDIAAPGVNILAQGYDPEATGEARHLGYGQVSGTSMASPHIAGSAALLRQLHPEWSNSDIKSALMTTSKYMEVYTTDGVPAQPLDMGAGRLDLTHAADPGVLLDMPSIGFGIVPSGTMESMTVTVRSVASATETYELSTLYTGDSFTQTTSLPGFTVSPTSLELDAGETAQVVVTFDSMSGQGIGDNQGYIIMDGETHHAHMPVWARVTHPEGFGADILILDNDGSTTFGFPDYSEYYSATLDALPYSYDYRDLDAEVLNGFPDDFLNIVDLLPYKAIVYFTGDNFYPNGTATVATPLTEADMYALNEYSSAGGHIVATGQDMAAVMNSTGSSAEFFYDWTLGVDYLQDSLNDETITPTLTVVPTLNELMEGVTLDLSGDTGDGADNQYYIDEIAANLSSAPEEQAQNRLDYQPILQLQEHEDNREEDGIVGVARRQQPTLENPGISWEGSAIVFSFGLEGVNSDTGHTRRAQLMRRALEFGFDEPQVTLTAEVDETSGVTNTITFMANFQSNLAGVTAEDYRWDYGDGQEYEGPYASSTVSHQYEQGTCDENTVARVEVTDSLGNHVVGTVTGFCSEPTAVDFGGISAGNTAGVNPLWLVGLFTLGVGALAIAARRRR